MSPFENDDQAIRSWLHGQAKETQSAYDRDIRQFRSFVQIPLGAIKLTDLQAYQKHLGMKLHKGEPLKVTTINRKIVSIKSLFGFCLKQGYIHRNPAAALKLSKVHRKLAGKILTVEEVMTLFGGASNPREEAFLRFLYYTSARVSEAIGVEWGKFIALPDGRVQVELHGKGDKVRSVLVPQDLWERLNQLRDKPKPFGWTRQTGDVIIKEAADRANLGKVISCHWLRHSHATHALRNGAPLSLVRDTLGHASVESTNVYLESFPGESSSTYL